MQNQMQTTNIIISLKKTKSIFRKNPWKNIVETQTAKTGCLIPCYRGSFLFVHTIKEVQALMVHLEPEQ